MMKFKILLFMFLTYIAVNAQDGAIIFKNATDQLLTTNMELSIEIKETRRNGRATEKSFNVLMGKFKDEEKIKTQILKPERAKGVTIVLTQYPETVGLIEIFTPANGKIRKMKATQKNIELVGSGSLISNYISKNQTELNIRYIEKQDINGKSCYKIEVNDKVNSKNGKAEFLIDEQNHHILEIISYDVNEKKESITMLSDYTALNTKIHPKRIFTENLKEKTTSEIIILNMTPRNNLKLKDFSISTTSD